MALIDSPDVILVLRALGLGDLLTGVPALRGLRRTYPSAWIALATPGYLTPLALLSRTVDEVVPTAGLGHLRWTGPAPDLAVNLHGSGPESIIDLQATSPKTLISHQHPQWPMVDGPPWRADLHDVDRWCALLETERIHCDATDLTIDHPDDHQPGDAVVVIHPGAAAPARRWPADRFAAVAAALSADGHDVVVTGSATERPLAEAVADGAGLDRSAVRAGELDVLDLTLLIADARLLVCGDTGVGHLATATGTRSVLLFGPTPPCEWGPRDSDRHVSIWAGNRGDPHGDRPHDGLLLISVERVVEASLRLLAEWR